MIRLLAAIAIAPLAILPILAILFGPWALAHGGLRTLLGILMPGVIVAYPLTLLCGLPLHLALVRERCTSRRHYTIAGALLGAVPVVGYVVVAVTFEAKFSLGEMGKAAARNLEWGAIGVIVFGLCTVAVALTFRAIALTPVKAFPS